MEETSELSYDEAMALLDGTNYLSCLMFSGNYSEEKENGEEFPLRLDSLD